MGMNMHDRYYEPEDDDYEEMDEYVSDWIEYESRKGGILDPHESEYFMEAVCQLRLREEIETFDDCTPEEQGEIMAYLLEMGERMAIDSYHDNL